MRRPINWFVFCLSLALLFANVALGRKPAPPEGQAAMPMAAQMDFSHVVVGNTPAPQFGYVRDDGSFLPLAEKATDDRSASKVPASF